MDDSLKERIIRLIKILGRPFNEVVTVIWINDELIIDSLSLTDDGNDFEMNIFIKADGEDFENILPSCYLNEEEMNNILNELEDILIRY